MTDLNATSAALLGLLHDGPATGGQLVARAKAAYGAFFSVTRSQVYRELPTLTERGLLRPGKAGARSSQPYVITAAGKRAFRSWATSSMAADQVRSGALLRVINADKVSGRQQAAVIESAREMYAAQRAQARADAKAAEDPTAGAVAAFAQAYAKAAIKLIDALERG